MGINCLGRLPTLCVVLSKTVLACASHDDEEGARASMHFRADFVVGCMCVTSNRDYTRMGSLLSKLIALTTVGEVIGEFRSLAWE